MFNGLGLQQLLRGGVGTLARRIKYVVSLLTADVARASSRTVMGFASGAALADGQSLLTVPDDVGAYTGARLATTVADGAALGGESFVQPEFDSATGLTLTNAVVSGGTLVITNGIGPVAVGAAQTALKIGDIIAISGYINSVDGNGFGIRVASFLNGANGTPSGKFAAPGYFYDEIELTTLSDQYISLIGYSGAFNAVIDNLSVKKVIPIWHTTDINGVPLPVEGLSVADAATNLLWDSANPATQTQSLAAGDWVLSIAGTGSVALSGGPTGTATEGSDVTFNLGGTTSVTFTVSGTVDRFQVETGTTASPFILTPVGATASRAADNATIPTPSVLTPESGAIEMVLTPDESGQDNVTVLLMQSGADYLTIKLLPTTVELRVVKDSGIEQVISADYTHAKDTSATIQAHYNTTYGMGLRACDTATGFPDDTFYESAWLGGVTIGSSIYLGSNNGVTVTKATFA